MVSRYENNSTSDGGYNEVKIGNQIWMSSNLNIERFANGDLIPQITKAEEWKKAGENQEPAWCYYENKKQGIIRTNKIYDFIEKNIRW